MGIIEYLQDLDLSVFVFSATIVFPEGATHPDIDPPESLVVQGVHVFVLHELRRVSEDDPLNRHQSFISFIQDIQEFLKPLFGILTVTVVFRVESAPERRHIIVVPEDLIEDLPFLFGFLFQEPLLNDLVDLVQGVFFG